MAQFFSVHPEQPQLRLIKQAAEIMRKGGLVAFPTDSAYALGGLTGDNALLARIRRIRGVDERHQSVCDGERAWAAAEICGRKAAGRA